MTGTLRSIRIDRWLWAVRLFKTRSLSAKACIAGHVKIEGQTVKPAREVREGDVIHLRTGFTNRTVRVVAVLGQRVGPKAAAQFVDDQTPPEEIARAREEALRNRPLFPPGSGRPTKKQRRQLESFMDRDPT